MKLIESLKLKALVERQLDLQMRKYLVKEATTHIHMGDPHTLLRGMRLAAELGAQGPDLVWVFYNNDLFFFDLHQKSEAEWCEIVENLQSRIPKNPRKVLVKMVALRLAKVYKAIDTINKRAARENPLPTTYYKHLELPAISMVTSKEDWAKAQDLLLKTDVSTSWQARREIDEFKRECLRGINSVLSREDIDESIVAEAGKDAWNMHVAQEVMES